MFVRVKDLDLENKTEERIRKKEIQKKKKERKEEKVYKRKN